MRVKIRFSKQSTSGRAVVLVNLNQPLVQSPYLSFQLRVLDLPLAIALAKVSQKGKLVLVLNLVLNV